MEKNNKNNQMFNKSIIWHLRNSVNNGNQNLTAGDLEDYFKELVCYEDNIYPKTYRECCEVLFGDESYSEFTLIPAKICTSYTRGDFITELPLEILPYEKQIRDFYKLLICRDAYWKIAGEQMGLGKPWKPDWDNDSQDKYCIFQDYNAFKFEIVLSSNVILTFPTEEMRDAFYDNFKELIEKCKELI